MRPETGKAPDLAARDPAATEPQLTHDDGAAEREKVLAALDRLQYLLYADQALSLLIVPQSRDALPTLGSSGTLFRHRGILQQRLESFSQSHFLIIFGSDAPPVCQQCGASFSLRARRLQRETCMFESKTSSDTGKEQRFRYRAAALQAPVEIRVEHGTVAQEGNWTIDLGKVERAAYVDHSFGRGGLTVSNVRLDLRSNGSWRSIGLTGESRGTVIDEDTRQHRAALIATLRALAAAQPGAKVTLGAAGWADGAMFVLGLIAVASGIGIAVAGLATGISGDRLIGAAVPVTLLLLIGLVTSSSHRPWRPRALVGASELADTLERQAAGPQAQHPEGPGTTG